MTKYATLVSRQLVGLIIVAYALGFWRSANLLSPGPHVVYPEIIIVVLVGLIFADALVGTLRLTSTNEPIAVPVDEDDTDYDGPKHWPSSLSAAFALNFRAWQRIIAMSVSTVLFVYLAPRLGFFEATGAFMIFGFYFLGLRRIRTLLLVWSITMAIIWFSFTRVLVVQRLPRGFLEALLFP